MAPASTPLPEGIIFVMLSIKFKAHGMTIPIALIIGMVAALASRAVGDPVLTIPASAWASGSSGVVQGTGFPPGPVHLIVTDDGASVWRGTVRADKNGVIASRIPIYQPGYYVLAADAAPPTSFAVVPTDRESITSALLSDPNHRLLLGICTHYAQRDIPESSFVMLRNLGVDFVRDEMYWGAVEKVKGDYNFGPRYDGYVKGLGKQGLKLLFVADGGNDLYDNGAPFTAGSREAFAKYSVAVLKRYRSSVMAVEVYNEPNHIPPIDGYFPVLRDTFLAIRAAGFRQPIIAVGGAGIGGGMNPDYASKIMTAGAASFCDGFSQHPYTSPCSADLGYPINDAGNYNASLDLALTRSRNLLKSFGKKRGSWITEIGWPSPTVLTEKKQAAFLARAILDASRYPGLEGLSTYDFQDDGPDPANAEHRFGIVRQDLSPKPAYQAFAVAAHFLRDKVFVRSIGNPDSPLWANVYRDSTGDYWLACWATEKTYNETGKSWVTDQTRKENTATQDTSDRRVSISVTAGKGRYGFDWQGRSLAIGQVTVVSTLPVYIDTKNQVDNIDIKVVNIWPTN